MTKKKYQLARLGPDLPRCYLRVTMILVLALCLTTPALAATDLWTAAQTIIVDIYSHIATLSTALAGLMSAIAVLGAKLSNNQHKVDQAWDWLSSSLLDIMILDLRAMFPSSRTSCRCFWRWAGLCCWGIWYSRR